MILNKKYCFFICAFALLFFTAGLSAQTDSIQSKFSFQGDFRFRFEQDWDSRKSDGSYRDDRSRLRYRLRAGAVYQHNEVISTGVRVRTGDPKKQQDPQLTLGDGFNEFGTLPIGFEHAYLKAEWTGIQFWLGKNTFTFRKNNELYWSDNVFPEGVFLQKKFKPSSSLLDFIDLNAGHFIINARGSSFENDGYFQGIQLHASFFEERLELFPAINNFRNIQNIPDGNETFLFDYSILHLGSSIKPLKAIPLCLEVDFYSNLEDYSKNDSIPNSLKDETMGLVAGLSYGELKEAGDWFFKLTYNHLEQYAAVDFLAQNDWARWDYSSLGSPDGRLTNYKGTELVVSYAIDKNTKLTMKQYLVEQLVAYGAEKETGSRIRFDIDIKF